jgi:hypothetical protein
VSEIPAAGPGAAGGRPVSLAGLPGPSTKELGPRFNLVSLLPSSALVLFVLLLLRSGAATGRPHLDRLTPGELLGQGRTLGDIGYLAVGIIVVSLILYPFQVSLTRAFEGYWGRSGLTRAAGAIGRELQLRRREMLELQLEALTAEDPPGDASGADDRDSRDGRVRTAKTQLSMYPEEDRLLPTRLGNVLRAAEDQAGQRYELDTVIIWPWLFPHVTGPLAQGLTETRSQLDAFVRLSVTLLVATVVAAAMLLTDGPWLVIPVITVLLAWTSYQAAVRTAVKYGQGIQVAFDAHRFDMLRALHYPLPPTLAAEMAFNRELVRFLDDGEPISGSEREHRYEHPDGQAEAVTTTRWTTPGAWYRAIVGSWRRQRLRGHSR